MAKKGGCIAIESCRATIAKLCMEITARVESPNNRSFILKVISDPEAPSRYFAQVFDVQKEIFAIGFHSIKSIQEAKQHAEAALRVYLNALNLEYPDSKVNWQATIVWSKGIGGEFL